ncbi:hypothetical protein Avbf_02318 [Armadillidium vulgare]|nr:hypothetical protein Avbf_02318 [Armadillidium vulgare]
MCVCCGAIQRKYADDLRHKTQSLLSGSVYSFNVQDLGYENEDIETLLWEIYQDRKIFYLPTEDPKMVIGHNFPLTSLPFSSTNIVHKNYVKFIKKKSNDSKTELERTLHSRKLRIQKLCSLRHMKDQYKISGEINVYWNKKRKLIWCSTYQHIPWISKLIDDKLLEQSKRITKVNDKIFRKLIKKINNSNYTSFLILKNPFTKISVPDENYSEALHLFYHYQHSNIGEFNKYFVGLNTTNLRSLIFDIYVNDFDLFGYDRAKIY